MLRPPTDDADFSTGPPHVEYVCSACSCDIAQFCAVEYVYGGRLVYSGDIQVLDVTVTTTDVRGGVEFTPRTSPAI